MSYTTLGRIKGVQQKGQEITFRGELAKVKLYILNHDLVRVRFAPDGKFPKDRSWAVVKTAWQDETDELLAGERSRWKPVSYKLTKSKDCYQVRTRKLAVKVQRSSGLLAFYRGKELIHTDCARDLYDVYKGMTSHHTGAVLCNKTLARDEYLYGLGERSGYLNKRGRLLRMYNHDAVNYDSQTTDPLHKHVPFIIGLRQGKAWGLFFNNPYRGEFDLGCYMPNRFSFRAEGGELDYYFFSGPSIAEIINRYTELTGRPLLPPKYTLGYLGSGMYYTEVDDAAQKISGFVDKTFEEDIPCDAFHLCSGYTTGPGSQRYVFNWNSKKLPKPERTIEYCHNNGIKLSANVKPGILQTHPRYDEAADAGLFIRDEKGDKPFVGLFWGGAASYIDFSNPNAVKWWKDNLKKSLFDRGIDSIWNDNCEYDVAEDDRACCHDYGRFTPIVGLRSLQSLLMSKAAFETNLEHKPNYRPWVVCRSGFAGIQRYAQVWSGDINVSFHCLKFSIPLGLGMGLSGVPNNGHDVAGLAGSIPGPELLVRWVENGIFQPRFTINSCRKPATAPWMYPEMLNKIRKLIKLRYQMIPYAYSLFFEASQRGVPIQRPLVYEFQKDPKCWENSFDFMFGPSLLIANVYEKGASERKVYLPAGTGWTNWWTEEHYEGGQELTIPAPLGRPPIFVRDGAIIPMCAAQKWIDRRSLKELVVHVYPKRDEGFTLFEDDGETFKYQEGKYLLTEFRCQSRTRNRLTISIKRCKRGFAPSKRNLVVRLHGGFEPRAVRLNGEVLPEGTTANKSWSYKEKKNIVEVRFPDAEIESRLSTVK